MIPPSKQNYYFVEPNDDDEKAIILEANTDLGFILKTQIAQLNDDEPTQREGNLPICRGGGTAAMHPRRYPVCGMVVVM